MIGHAPKLMALWLTKFFETAYKQRESYCERASELTEVEVMAWKSLASMGLKAIHSPSHG